MASTTETLSRETSARLARHFHLQLPAESSLLHLGPDQKWALIHSLLFAYDATWCLPDWPILIGQGQPWPEADSATWAGRKKDLAELKRWVILLNVGHLWPKKIEFEDEMRFLHFVNTLQEAITHTLGPAKLLARVRGILKKQARAHFQLIGPGRDSANPTLNGAYSSLKHDSTDEDCPSPDKENVDNDSIKSDEENVIPNGSQLPRTPMVRSTLFQSDDDAGSEPDDQAVGDPSSNESDNVPTLNLIPSGKEIPGTPFVKPQKNDDENGKETDTDEFQSVAPDQPASPRPLNEERSSIPDQAEMKGGTEPAFGKEAVEPKAKKTSPPQGQKGRKKKPSKVLGDAAIASVPEGPLDKTFDVPAKSRIDNAEPTDVITSNKKALKGNRKNNKAKVDEVDHSLKRSPAPKAGNTATRENSEMDEVSKATLTQESAAPKKSKGRKLKGADALSDIQPSALTVLPNEERQDSPFFNHTNEALSKPLGKKEKKAKEKANSKEPDLPSEPLTVPSEDEPRSKRGTRSTIKAEDPEEETHEDDSKNQRKKAIPKQTKDKAKPNKRGKGVQGDAPENAQEGSPMQSSQPPKGRSKEVVKVKEPPKIKKDREGQSKEELLVPLIETSAEGVESKKGGKGTNESEVKPAAKESLAVKRVRNRSQSEDELQDAPVPLKKGGKAKKGQKIVEEDKEAIPEKVGPTLPKKGKKANPETTLKEEKEVTKPPKGKTKQKTDEAPQEKNSHDPPKNKRGKTSIVQKSKNEETGKEKPQGRGGRASTRKNANDDGLQTEITEEISAKTNVAVKTSEDTEGDNAEQQKRSKVGKKSSKPIKDAVLEETPETKKFARSKANGKDLEEPILQGESSVKVKKPRGRQPPKKTDQDEVHFTEVETMRNTQPVIPVKGRKKKAATETVIVEESQVPNIPNKKRRASSLNSKQPREVLEENIKKAKEAEDIVTFKVAEVVETTTVKAKRAKKGKQSQIEASVASDQAISPNDVEEMQGIDEASQKAKIELLDGLFDGKKQLKGKKAPVKNSSAKTTVVGPVLAKTPEGGNKKPVGGGKRKKAASKGEPSVEEVSPLKKTKTQQQDNTIQEDLTELVIPSNASLNIADDICSPPTKGSKKTKAKITAKKDEEPTAKVSAKPPRKKPVNRK